MDKKIEDEIKFHILFNSVREYRHIPLNIVCYGLCSESMMYYYESGERLPNYRMRNRLMARLGVSSEEYEDYVQFDEYERWERCQKLIDDVENKNTDIAETNLYDLLSTIDIDDKIEHQFLLDMQGRIMELKGESWEKIHSIYNQAVNITMPNLDISKIQEYVLAPDEYYIILRLLRAKSMINFGNNNEFLCDDYKNICESIRNSFFQVYAKAKVYPMAVCGWYDYAISSGIIDTQYRLIWANSENALNGLRDAGRTYYLLDLLKLRRDIFYILEKDNSILFSQKNSFSQEQKWLQVFSKLYSNYGIDPSMNYCGYIYIDSEVYCISDIISSRRKLYGMTFEELSSGVCSSRTLMRIEHKKARPQQYVVEHLFRKLGIVSDYRRAEIMTNEYITMVIYKAYKHAINDADWESADKLSRILHTKLDHGNLANRQMLADNINEEKLRKKEIDTSRYEQNLKKVINFSLPISAKFYSDSYLSDAEVTIIYNLAFKGNQKDLQNMLREKCESYFRKRIRNHISLYELIMGNVASRLGDEGNYNESNKISDFIITEALKLKRSHSIHRNIFHITWNDAMENGNYYDDNIIENLDACIAVASYTRDVTTREFYQNKLDLLSNHADWTQVI